MSNLASNREELHDESDDGESSGSSSSSDDASAARRCCAGPRTPTLVPKGTPFFHKACCAQAVGIFCSYWFLMLGGIALARHVPGAALLLLTVGPTVVIILGFMHRYSFSTRTCQVIITFFEAVAWMVPLMLVIGMVDSWNERLTTTDVEVPCTMDAASATDLVWVLSFTSRCSAAADNTTDVQWDEERCPAVAHTDGTKSGIVIKRDGSFPAMLIEQIENITLNTEEAEEGEDTDSDFCPGFVAAVGDIVDNGPLRVTAIQTGKGAVNVASREDLGRAYGELCEVRTQTSEGDQCATWAEGNVTVTFGFRKKTIAYALFEAYFRAGFLEELLKYGAVRRILFKDRVVDCGGLIVYGLAAGAGFATAENIEYTFMGGLEVALTRMYLSIPLHCCTGLIIGIYLGYRKFLGKGYYCLTVLMAPVLIHGTYDFLLMLPGSAPVPQEVRLLGAIFIVLAAFVYCRFAWLPLDAVCVVNVRDMERQGRISRPSCCCCECDCCTAWFVHQDPLVNNAGSDSEDPRPQRPVPRSSSMQLVAQTTVDTLRVIIPRDPQCQTTPTTCPGCDARVRAHRLFPSYCPHCAAEMPDSVLRGSAQPGVA